MTGNEAEKVKDEIIKLEEEKASMILKGGSIAADYYDRFYDDDEAYLSSGRGSRTKADILSDWRSGVPKILSTKHYDFRVRVFDNGNTAVVTYRATGAMQLKDKVASCSPQRSGYEKTSVVSQRFPGNGCLLEQGTLLISNAQSQIPMGSQNACRNVRFVQLKKELLISVRLRLKVSSENTN